jgi:hypothetical protein
MRLFPLFAALLLTVIFGLVPSDALANPLNTWDISCSVDKGASKRKGKTWTFRTSKNRCTGGTFNQRAEIKSKSITPRTKDAYMFSAYVAMTTVRTEKFDIFQIHDGRRGCAPPLKVTVLKSGLLELRSDVQTGPGTDDCIMGTLGGGKSNIKFRRDGTEHFLEILLDFDGKGGFDVTVWIDKTLRAKGRYTPSPLPQAFKPEKYYFKHGVYSKNIFDYVLTSREMKVRKVRLKN